MRTPPLALALLLLAACTTTVPPAPQPAEIERRVPFMMKEAGVPGVAIAIVEGEKVTEHHFGRANVETGAEVDADTVFEAASLSKPVFAWAVMRLVDEGLLDLDAPLTRYVREPFLEDPRGGAITARMVLTHHTGLPNWRPRGKPLELVFDPGTRFSYSGEGFVYLQRAVEAVTGEPLETLMRRLVFEPLQMSSSSYHWRPEYDRTKASAHNALGEAPEWRKHGEILSAASLHTTSGDLGRFLSAVLTGETLSEISTRALLAPQVAAPVDCSNCSRRKEPVPPSEDIFWGLGWGLVRSGEGFDAWHWGDNNAFKAYIYGDPREQRGVVVLTNGASGLSIAGEIATMAMAGTDDPPRAQLPLEWVNYPRWDAPSHQALQRIAREGEAALGWLREQTLDESDINVLGYGLLRAGRTGEAVWVFRLNTERHPGSWNVWDSLGEGLVAAGERNAAHAAYSESVRLKPDSVSGKEALRLLSGEERLDPSLASKITGRYESARGMSEVRHVDGALEIKIEGRVIPLIVISPTRFIGASDPIGVEITGDGELTIVRDGKRVTLRPRTDP